MTNGGVGRRRAGLACRILGDRQHRRLHDVLIPLALIFRPKLPNDRGGWVALLISAMVGFFGSFVLQGLGIPRTSTTHAALILTLPPVFTAMVQFLFSRS